MDGRALPAVCLPTVIAGRGADDEESPEKKTPIVDLPPSGKFGFAWPSEHTLTEPVSHALPTNIDTQLDSSEIESSDGESNSPLESPPQLSELGGVEGKSTDTVADEASASIPPPPLPRLSRAFSMPLPSQIGHLKNPRRLWAPSTLGPSTPAIAESSSSNASNFHELSLELADSVQMVIQTLLQISPPQLLDPAKEQFSACSLSIPSPSVSAMLTAMKNLNYMSANMSTLGSSNQENHPFEPEDFSPPTPTNVQDDFDIGEMLQSVGDALSGLAAQAGVDLVLFHADVGMKHMSVKGDECGLSYALSHVVRQVLDTAQAGDTIEIGLFISAEGHKRNPATGGLQSTAGRPSSPSSPGLDGQSSLACTFDVAHKFAIPDLASPVEEEHEPSPTSPYFDLRARPQFDTHILRRLLRHMRATLKTDLQPRLFTPGRACELSLTVTPGSPSILTQPIQHSPLEESIRPPFANANVRLASEPSLEELMMFAESLRGKKVALHASAKGSFAHHLTSYLTAWGLDVSHMSTVPVLDPDAIPGGFISTLAAPSGQLTSVAASPAPMEQLDPNPLDTVKPSGPPTFVIIDDDIAALRRRLLQLKSEAPYALHLHPRQRPSLASNHRPRSSPQVLRAKGTHPGVLSPQGSPPVIVHFTSLSNYKLVKDVLQSVLSNSPGSSGLIPEVIVLPKPAGPRRLLTALRTAVLKPIVDPFFSPIATSPMSPNVHGLGAPFFSDNSPSNRSSRPPISPRTNSDRSSKSSKEHVGEPIGLPPPSPLGHSDPMEYFSEAAVKLGTSPSSGLVIQSPDGQPAGIFFHPRGTTRKIQRLNDNGANMSSPPMIIRDVGNLRPPADYRRSSMSRRIPSDGDKSGSSPTTRPALLTRHRSSLSYPPVSDPALGTSGEPSSSTSGSSMKGKGRPSMSPRSNERGSVHPKDIITTSSPATGIVGSGRSTSPETYTAPPSAFTRGSVGMSNAVDVLLRKSTSPPASPLSPRLPGSPGPVKRVANRRTPMEAANGSAAAKKGRAGTESNIVPPISVLIVEDNPINQTILSTFMRKKKIKYDVAKNGEEAVAKWQLGTFHLILMDIQMPVMDGIQATKEIRRQEKVNAYNGFPPTPSDGQQTPSDAPSTDSRASSTAVSTPFRSSVIIVALTASSLQTDRVAALAAGCNDFLTKPVSLQWLNNKIIEWGSIKALQMWADLRPEVVKSISSGQVARAGTIANNLYVPEGRRSSSGSRTRSASLSKDPVVNTPPALETPQASTPKPAAAHGHSASLSDDSVITTPSPPLTDAPQVETPKGLVSEPVEIKASQHLDASDSDDAATLENKIVEEDLDPTPTQSLDVKANQDLNTTPKQSMDTKNITVQEDAVSVSSSDLHSNGEDHLQLPSVRPSAPRLITGEDALLAHIKDSTHEALTVAERESLARPVILGERAISSSNLSIAEVLHTDATDEKSSFLSSEADAPQPQADRPE